MSALFIGAVVFVCAFGGALFGISLGAMLPKHHLSTDSRDVIKIATAMIATLAALVVGLLIASAKSSYDTKDSELRRMAAQIILLDRTLAQYGPETSEVRDHLRQLVAMRISQIWPDEKHDMVAPKAVGQGQAVEEIERQLLDLAPQNDVQHSLRSTAIQIIGQIAEARWLVLEQLASSIQWPFLTILIFWFAMILCSFGLFAPRNGSVIAALFICSLSVAGALYLIVQMDQPYSGLIKLSSAPLRAALNQIGR